MGKFRDAEPLLLRSVQSRERTGPTDALANALVGLGNCYSFQAKHDQAIAALRRSLAIEATLVGEKSEDYFDPLETLARALSRASRFDEAETAFRRVIAGRRATGAEKSSIA